MHLKSWIAPAAAAVLFAGAQLISMPAARAGVVNGSFETGDVTGWTASPNGLVSVLTSSIASDLTVYNPTDGRFLASLLAGDTNVYTTLSQTFTVGPTGAVLSGDAAFLAHDFFLNNDDAFVKITSGPSSTALFQSSVLAVGDFGATPWTSFSEFLSPGIYTIQAGVRNDGDSSLSSELLLDDVKLTAAVPEPATWTLALVGFAMLGVGMATRKRRSVRLAA